MYEQYYMLLKNPNDSYKNYNLISEALHYHVSKD